MRDEENLQAQEIVLRGHEAAKNAIVVASASARPMAGARMDTSTRMTLFVNDRQNCGSSSHSR